MVSLTFLLCFLHSFSLSLCLSVSQDIFNICILMAKPIGHTTDFKSSSETDLQSVRDETIVIFVNVLYLFMYSCSIRIPLTYQAWSSGAVHGLAFWFDVAFLGSQ